MPDVPGVDHRFLDVRGFSMHVAEAGARDGEPVLLLHGWPQHWYAWHPLIERLGERYRLICPDLRGFGWSGTPARGYDKGTLGDDAVALLDALGLERVHLVAHDWGGWAGFVACIDHPERFRSYLALNIPHPFQSVHPRSLPAFVRSLYQWVLGAPLVGERVVRRLARADRGDLRRRGAQSDAWTDEELRIYYDQFLEPERVRASVLIYRQFVIRDLPLSLGPRHKRKGLHVPTLLLFGEDDPFIHLSALRGYRPHAPLMRVELVRDVGHFIVDEAPDLVAAKAVEVFRGA